MPTQEIFDVLVASYEDLLTSVSISEVEFDGDYPIESEDYSDDEWEMPMHILEEQVNAKMHITGEVLWQATRMMAFVRPINGGFSLLRRPI